VIHRLVELEGHTVTVTDPDRRLYGDDGPTKTELMAYYAKVAPRLVPFLRGRAVSTVFGPTASTEEFRFARTAPPGCPGRFATYRLPSFGRPELERLLTVPDIGALEALVDYGCVSFHPWNSTALAALQPTQMVFNLDPEAIAFREVRNAALLLRELLGVCGLTAWVKTSGRHGLHVLVPLTGTVSFGDTRLVADTIATRAIRREPTLFSRDPRRGKRRGRILIDTSRNACGATIIAPYAIATSGLVSALLEWDELQRPLYPDEFDLARVVAREHTDANNQAAFFAAEQRLEPIERYVTRIRARGTSSLHPRRDGEPLHAGTSVALVEEARCLRASSRRLRDNAEATRIESGDLRERARKVRDDRP
jgi:bifunctional non-homologous end joining protein LigD